MIHGLAEHRHNVGARRSETDSMPVAPLPFVAHRYSLSHTQGFIGRQSDLAELTNWATHPHTRSGTCPILTVVAAGGTGKTALTWKWFNDIAVEVVRPLAGRMWWSFYESDATMDSFITSALAYATNRTPSDFNDLSRRERQKQLLAALDRDPYLFVMDGLERIFTGYKEDSLYQSEFVTASSDASTDVDSDEEHPANLGDRDDRWRKTADPRDGEFLRALSTIGSSRILMSSRHFPADLQSRARTPLPGCAPHFLKGLDDDDAIKLWRAYGVTGSPESLGRMFRTINNHALMIQVLAGQVACDRKAQGNFDRWQTLRRDFDPFKLPLVQRHSHILHHSLRGLDPAASRILQTIAGFHESVAYPTLLQMHAGGGKNRDDENALDHNLAELEDRGLLGWDRSTNRYSMHPIVRGVTWKRLNPSDQQYVRDTIDLQLEQVPAIPWRQVTSFEDLLDPAERYRNLVALKKHTEAVKVFADQLNEATFYRLSANEQRIELLEMMFPDGINEKSALQGDEEQAFIINALAQSYLFVGQADRSLAFFRQHVDLQRRLDRGINLSISLRNLSDACRLTGRLRDAEAAAREAIVIARETMLRREEAEGLGALGLVMAIRGEFSDAEKALNRACLIDARVGDAQGEGVSRSYRVQLGLIRHEAGEELNANDLIEDVGRSSELAQRDQVFRDLLRAKRLAACVALVEKRGDAAENDLYSVLGEARRVRLVEEELAALCDLARLRLEQSRYDEGKQLLDEIWHAAEHGRYQVLLSGAYCILAQIQHRASDSKGAIAAARRAYESAWCDGPPFAYKRALDSATTLLQTLGELPPDLPRFDARHHEPLPQVAIDPPEDPFVRPVE